MPVELWVLIRDVAKMLATAIDCERDWQVSLILSGDVLTPTTVPRELLDATRTVLINQDEPIYEYGVFVITFPDVNFQMILVCNLRAGFESVNTISSFRKVIQRAFPPQTFKVFLATFDQHNDLSISVVNRSQRIINNELDGAFVMGRRVVPRRNIMKPHRIADFLRC